MRSGEREDKGADRVAGFARMGIVLRPSLDLYGTFDARLYGCVGRGSVVILGYKSETSMMEKLMDKNGTASRVSNVGWFVRDFVRLAVGQEYNDRSCMACR